MFRSIRGTLDKKKNNLIKAEGKSSNINRVFGRFLDEHFADYKDLSRTRQRHTAGPRGLVRDLFKWNASYRSKDGKVIISTGSKLIAGEISLKIKELSRLLKEENLKVTQIVIL